MAKINIKNWGYLKKQVPLQNKSEHIEPVCILRSKVKEFWLKFIERT